MSNLYKASKIGSLEIRNRFIMTPMNLAYCPKGYVNDQLIEFYRARAKGGVGLIIVGAVGVDPDRVNTTSVMQIYEDSFIPGLKKLTKAIHAQGAKIFPQIWHPGAYARSKEHSGQQAVAPSEIISNFTREQSYALKIKEIEQIVGYFGAAAKRAKQSGFDGVEIVASAGYLIAQFLSPATNKRTDKYGGDLHARMTFLLEIIRVVRKAVGPDFPVMVRIAGNEYIRGGNTNEDAVKIAKAIEKAGVDAINVTGGWHETAIPQLTMDVPPAAYLYLAKQVKKGINIPVVACNRIDVKTAERIINNQEADFVGIARGFVADADFVKKAIKNKYDLIRPCIGCNQGCMDNVFKGKPL
ncbi:MAG: NADH:flavin oxidoreductase, partial [Deltaproteobacteria bacterium]